MLLFKPVSLLKIVYDKESLEIEKYTSCFKAHIVIVTVFKFDEIVQ